MFVSSHGLFTPNFDSWCFLMSTCFMGTVLEFFPFGSGAVLVPLEVLLVLSLLRVAVTKAGSARLCSAGVFDPAARQLWDVHGSAAEGTLMQIRDELAGLSLEQDRGERAGASHSSQVSLLN